MPDALDQRAAPPFTPARWLIPWLMQLHVCVYSRSGGRLGTSWGGLHHLLLTAIGRRSGKPHVVCLPYWLDEDGSLVVVASFAGSPKHPAWYLNVTDRVRNASVSVRDGRKVYAAEAEILTGTNRERVWAALTADRPFYADYQKRTAREIPLVWLRRTHGRVSPSISESHRGASNWEE